MRMLLLLCAALLAVGCRKPPPPLEDMGTLPAFAMVDQDGQPVADTSLRGTVWIANFLFTSCPTQCPPLAKATAELQNHLKTWMPAGGKPPIRIVSISVDPLTDTPEVLRAFGQKYGEDPKVWTLLTGEYDAMERLVVQGFMQPIIRADRVIGLPSERTATHEPTPLDTAHSLRFVLVDRQGHLRGLFDRDAVGLQTLEAAARQLVDE